MTKHYDSLQRRLSSGHFHIDASVRGRNNLMRISTILRIKNRTDLSHEEEIFWAKDQRHLPHLFHTNTMLTGQATTEINAGLENLLPSLYHAFRFVGIALVIQQNRVDIA